MSFDSPSPKRETDLPAFTAATFTADFYLVDPNGDFIPCDNRESALEAFKQFDLGETTTHRRTTAED